MVRCAGNGGNVGGGGLGEREKRNFFSARCTGRLKSVGRR